MKINVSRETELARKIGSYEGKLQTLKSNLANSKTTVNSGWKAQEVVYINQALTQVMNELSKIAPDLRSIETEIISTANAIKKEEDEKEAAELAAKEAALKKMQEKAQ